MKRILTLTLLGLALLSQAGEPPGYYDSATNKEGRALRQALHAIIKNHTVIPYSSTAFDTSDALKLLDQDPGDANRVVLIYSGFTDAKTNFGLTIGWNREHLWPNSYGLDDVQPAFSDLHNLRAIDSNVNSSRGNKYYDTSDTNSPSYRFPAFVDAPLCSTDIDSWEPRAVDRGNIARSLFYMDVRYEGDHVNEPNLALTEHTNLISSATNLMGRLSTILAWSAQDTVDASEQLRNDGVYSLQHNRNPFVDHPEWVDLVFRPRLHVNLATNTIVLYWGTEWTNAVLETSANVPVSWSLFGTPTNTGTRFELTVPTTNSHQFFRLQDNP